MSRKVIRVSETRAIYKTKPEKQARPRNPMRNMKTAAKLIVRAHERAFRELEKF